MWSQRFLWQRTWTDWAGWFLLLRTYIALNFVLNKTKIFVKDSKKMQFFFNSNTVFLFISNFSKKVPLLCPLYGTMWRDRLWVHVFHHYNVPHVLFSQTALTLWQPFWLKSLAADITEYLSKVSIFPNPSKGMRAPNRGNWRPHYNLSVGRTWYKITWVRVPKQYVLVCREKKEKI